MLNLCLLILLFGMHGQAQQPATPSPMATPMPRGPIKGRVITEDGETISGITVTAMPIGSGANRAGRGGPQPGGTFSQATTDDEGNFVIDGLTPASYSLMASAPGYVTAPPTVSEDGKTGANVFHPGEIVTLTLVKGGVITGKVFSQTGEPLTGINVRAQRIGSVTGEADIAPQAFGFQQQWRTDDQGEYRIYGLVTGVYVVQAGGRSNSFGGFAPGPPNNNQFSEDAPTFYPSAVRDGATPITVYAGAEASGIDIRYRNLRGFAVSGKVISDKSLNTDIPGRGFAPTVVTLNLPGTETIIATTAQVVAGVGPGPRGGTRSGNEGFAFYGIAEGDYDLVAVRNTDEYDANSGPKRISVRGADVSGLELTLLPLASISGKVRLEKLIPAEPSACRSPRPAHLVETLLRAVNETAPPKTIARRAAPDVQGTFTLRGLNAGRYRLAVDLPSPIWYLRQLQWEKPAPTSTTRKPASAAPPVVANPVRDGLTLKQGERANGLIVTLAEGAASLSGNGKAFQLVHLIPAEPTAADELLRYAQTYLAKDGAFRFTNLAPGKYWLLTQIAKPVERPLAWDANQRLALQRQAPSQGKLIELAPCENKTVPASQ